MPETNKAEWQHDIQEILKSPRIAEMTFHVPKVDKDKEIISAEAMSKALEDYRHFPIISEFHKERPIGVAEKIWQTQGDEFKALIRIREDPSVDDVWAKMNLPEGTPGRYDQVSIAGRRTEFSTECNLHQSQRSAHAPCRTTGLRLDSISVCDDAARNTSTSLAVVKASKEDPLAFVYTTFLSLKQVDISLIKAETTDSNLIHPVTDGAKRKAGETGVKMKKCNKPPVEKAEEESPAEDEKEEKEETQKGEAGEPEKEEMEKAPPEGSTVEAEEASENKKMLQMMEMVLQKLGELVQSDKKVHSEVKAEPEEKEEKKEEKKVEKAEVPPAATPEIQKAAMEQDIKKAVDAALAPVLAELETLKKANTEIAAKLEEYANEPISKSGILIQRLNVDDNGTPVLGNAGAMAKAIKTKEAIQ